jgi:RND family efflux transporter MFP subunit
VSASAYDKIKAAADSARAELKAAQAQASVAHNETGYAVLLADSDGVVVDTLAEPGQVVSAGQVVVRVAHAGRREAVIALPETLRPPIGSAGRASLYGSGLTGVSKLRQLSDAANPQTRTFEARYILEGRLADAPLGSTVAIEIPNGRSAPTLQIPLGAIFDPGKGPGVWLVKGQGGQGQAPQVTWRAVQVAGLREDAAFIAGGLAAGDRVVVLGAHLLHEGEPVRLADGAAAQSVAEAGGKSQ